MGWRAAAGGASTDPFYRHVAFPILNPAPNFQSFFKRLSRLQDLQIKAYFQGIPPAWSDHRCVRLEEYLYWARDHADRLLHRLRAAFST